MGAVKNAFHEHICWNELDDNEKQDALFYASAIETREGGDVQQAPSRSDESAVGDSQDAQGQSSHE